jgi:DNA-binding transcriptional MerR regulator/methylmalonyl-CoA mutase cobalamin-binding subunit
VAYWIKAVADMTGIPKNTLIAWERRHGVVKPERASSGYRVYSEADVAVLHRIKQLLDDGMRISDAAKRVREENRAGNRDVTQRAPDEVLVGLPALREALLEALLAFDQPEVQRLYPRLVGVPFATIIDDVVLPIVHDVGQLWEEGEASVAQEHYVTSWCRDQILAMARTVQPERDDAPEAICATPQGEHHEIGLLGAAYHLAARGHRLIYLGADVPSDQLVELVAERRPAVVALSYVLPRNDFDIVGLAHRLHDAMGGRGEVVVGGRASTAHRDASTEHITFGA